MISNETPLPWPEKGDQLFVEGNDWWHRACLNYMPDDWGLYTFGYKKAGDLLIRYVLEEQREQDFLVYPIVFLYRQYLELQMKRLIRDGNQAFDQPPEFPMHHDLEKLWVLSREIIRKVWPEHPEEDLEAIDECIKQFCEMDPTSMTFRYPLDKEGKRMLPENLRYINLRNLAEVVDKIAMFLNGATDGILAGLQARGY